MAASTRTLARCRKGIGVIALLVLLAPSASADCVRDSYGEVYCGGGRCQYDRGGNVWCSRYFLGGIERTQDGRLLCGKGQCAKDLNGRIYCSSEVGGSVLRDSRGRVRCYGRCEPGAAEHCENTRADAGG
jgi:hypothetical protein